MTLPQALDTPHGTIRFPAYVPVTTFGKKYPLDNLLRPYLPRLAPALMVSLHYARQMTDRPNIPLLIDSGGFASLFKDARVSERSGLGVLERSGDDGEEPLHPRDVLDFQEEHADIAFTLDFPIPPSMDRTEARRRQQLTIANALWALNNRRRRDMHLFACVQGWDIESYRECARALAEAPFDGIGLGGLVPRARDLKNVLAIVDAVREAVPDRPLHAFGIGKPETVDRLYRHGVQSVDSSAYVRLAASGRLWGHPGVAVADASPIERVHLALANLAIASNATLPLGMAGIAYRPAGLPAGCSSGSATATPRAAKDQVRERVVHLERWRRPTLARSYG